MRRVHHQFAGVDLEGEEHPPKLVMELEKIGVSWRSRRSWRGRLGHDCWKVGEELSKSCQEAGKGRRSWRGIREESCKMSSVGEADLRGCEELRRRVDFEEEDEKSLADGVWAARKSWCCRREREESGG